MESALVIVNITAPSMEIAQLLAQSLVDQRLAACVNLVGPIQSVYLWQGSIHQDEEVLMIVKTRRAHMDAIAAVLKDLHPYDLPELIALPVVGGSPAYLDWVAQSTKR